MRILLLCTLLAGQAVRAGEIIQAEVEHRDDRYFITVEMFIDAHSDRIHALLTDYDNLTRLNTSIKQSRVIFSLDEHTHRVSVVTETCVLWFCFELKQVQDVEELDNGIVIVTDVPEKSDTVYGHTRWHIRSADGGTRVSYDSDLKPDFWIPPLIGPMIIKRKLRDASLETITGLERLANQVQGDDT